MSRKNLFFYFFVLTIFLSFGVVVHAQEIESYFTTFRIDDRTAESGVTINSSDGNFVVGLTPGVLKHATRVHLKNFWEENRYDGEEFGKVALEISDPILQPKLFAGEVPFGYEIVGDIYEFDIEHTQSVYDPERPIWLRFKNPAPEDDRWKGIFYYDKGKKDWIEIPSTYDVETHEFKAAIHLPYAMVAVLGMSKTEGIASWYRYRDCDCTAAIDYPKGSYIRVTNIANDKSIVVQVNDYGPERWTKRLVDLDKTAFAKISSIGLGLINVMVEPLSDDELDVFIQSLIENDSEGFQGR